MTKLTRKLFMSVFAVAFAVIALATTTFAWIALNNTAEVTSIETTIGADSGIEISFSGVDGTYQSLLIFNEDFFANDFNLKPVTLSSGVDEVPVFKLLDGNQISATKLAMNLAGTAASTRIAGTYVIFDLYIRATPDSTGANDDYLTKVWLDRKATTMKADNKLWTSDAIFNKAANTQVAANEQVNYHASDAARFAIYSANFNKVDTDGDKLVVYENDAVGTNTLGFCGYEYGSVDYYNVKSGETSDNYPIRAGATAIPTPYLTQKLDLTVSPGDEKNDANLILVLDADNPATITVYIWLEGWDTECFNAIIGEKITTLLSFTSAVESKN